MIHLILLLLAVFVLWAISVYAHPFRHCRRCQGTGRRTTGLLRRSGFCARCQGTGRVQRIGSRLAHQTVLSLRAEYGTDPRKNLPPAPDPGRPDSH